MPYDNQDTSDWAGVLRSKRSSNTSITDLNVIIHEEICVILSHFYHSLLVEFGHHLEFFLERNDNIWLQFFHFLLEYFLKFFWFSLLLLNLRQCRSAYNSNPNICSPQASNIIRAVSSIQNCTILYFLNILNDHLFVLRWCPCKNLNHREIFWSHNLWGWSRK